MDSQEKQQIKDARAEFFAVLGHEYMLATGYGMYAHLTHRDIERLFEQFLAQSAPLRSFARATVRNS